MDGTGHNPATAGIVIPEFSEITEIGRDGNSVLYRARQDRFDRIVVLKVITNIDSEAARRRFRREQAAVGRLSDVEGILTVYGHGTTPLGRPYLVLPHLQAGSLADLMQVHGPMVWQEAIRLMARVASAVEIAHEEGVFHGDIKPESILLDVRGNPQLSGFGTAHVSEETMTVGYTAHSPVYAAPELLSAETGPSAATDVYGLGVTTAALLLGRSPFGPSTGSTLGLLETVNTVLSDPPTLPTDCPDAVTRLLAWSLRKDPAARPPSAAHVASLFEELARGGTAPEIPRTAGMAAEDTILSGEQPTTGDGPARPPVTAVNPVSNLDAAGRPLVGSGPRRPSRGPSNSMLVIGAFVVTLLLVALGAAAARLLL